METAAPVKPEGSTTMVVKDHMKNSSKHSPKTAPMKTGSKKAKKDAEKNEDEETEEEGGDGEKPKGMMKLESACKIC